MCSSTPPFNICQVLREKNERIIRNATHAFYSLIYVSILTNRCEDLINHICIACNKPQLTVIKCKYFFSHFSVFVLHCLIQ